MKDCVYDLTINDTWIMQSLYHSNKKFGERKSHIESYFCGTKVVQYRFCKCFCKKKRFANNLVLFAYIIISLTNPSCQ